MLFTKWALIFMKQKTPKKSYPPEWENPNMVVSNLNYFISGLKAPLSEGWFHPKKSFKLSKLFFYKFRDLN